MDLTVLGRVQNFFIPLRKDLSVIFEIHVGVEKTTLGSSTAKKSYAQTQPLYMYTHTHVIL